MHVKYSFACEAANVSKSGNLNALGIFTNFNVKQFPAVHPKFTYVANVLFLNTEAGEHNFKLAFIDDGGLEIMPMLSGTVSVGPKSLSVNIIMELARIKFPHEGTYQIDLVMDNRQICSELIKANLSK